MVILRLENNGYYYANYKGDRYVFNNIDSAGRYFNEWLGSNCKGIKIPLTKYAIIYFSKKTITNKIMKTTKEKAEIMLAFDRGEQIQFYDTVCNRWIDVINEPKWCWSLHDYRIKPKTGYVPFETAEEFLEAKRKHGRTIKRIENGMIYNSFVDEDGYLLLRGNDERTSAIDILCGRYVFADGTPCGKEAQL